MRSIVATAFLLSMLAACSSGNGGTEPGKTPTTQTTENPSGATEPGGTAPLRGVIALGHSALTGANSDPTHPGADAPQNSWATGTNPKVDSIYRRLAAADPASRGHAANAAVDGASADTLAAQAGLGLSMEPNPRLVIIQTIDNDIKCDGTDKSNYAQFGRLVKEALDVLVKAAPDTTILLMSQPGRPLPASLAIAGNTAAASTQSGKDMCSPFNPDLTINRQHIRTLTGIIAGYEAELAKVCATVPQCHTDHGRATHFQVPLSYYSSDWNHLNVTGLAALARFMWPTIEQVLQL